MMKHIATLVFIFVISFGLKSSAQIKSIEKFLEKKEYEKAYKRLTKEYASNPQDVEILYMLAEFYSDIDSPFKNYRLAYSYTSKIIPLFEQAVYEKNGRKILKWKKVDITLPNIRTLQKEIAEQALSEAKRINTIESYNSVIEFFSSEYAIVNTAIRYRNAIAFYDTKSINDIKAYESFIQNYPKSYQVKEAIRLKNNLLYQKALKKDSVQQLLFLQKNNTDMALANEIDKKINQWAFEEAVKSRSSAKIEHFLIHYPTAEQYGQALDFSDIFSFEEETAAGTSMSYLSFAKKNQSNKNYDTAIDSALTIAWRNKDTKTIESFLKNFHLNTAWDSIYLKYYKWYTCDGEPITINIFKKTHADFPYKTTLESDLKLFNNLNGISLSSSFSEKDFPKYTDFIRMFMTKNISFVILQRTLENFISSKNKTAALQRLNNFEICFEDNNDFYDLKKLLNNTNDNIAYKQQLSFEGYVIQNVTLTPNGKTLYLVLLKDGVSDIYTSKKTKTGFDIPQKILGLRGNDCPFWVSDDETQMLFGRDGDIYIAQNTDGYWLSKGKLPSPINTQAYETDAVFTPDGKGILFVSDREGGKNLQPSHAYFHGDTLLASDIYYSEKNDTGWSEPVNLNINTRYCERFPVLSSDMKTLFFTSDGYGGLGHSEIMTASRSCDTSWNVWEAPKNMGFEVNSSGWDCNPNITQNGDLFYYFSKIGKTTNSLLYEVVFKKKLFKNKIRTLHININSKNDSDENEIVYLIDLKNNIIQFDSSKDVKFKYLLNHKYGTFAAKKGYISTSELVYNDTSQNDLTVNLTLYRTKDLSLSNQFIDLNSILFDSLSILLKSSSYELQNLAEEIKTLGCGIEIHVSNNIGTNTKKCFETSIEQAASIKSFLIAEGIDPIKIITIGLGNLKNTNNIKIRLFNTQ